MDILIGVGIPLVLAIIIVVGMVIYHIGWIAGFKRSDEVRRIAEAIVRGDEDRNDLGL